jgi:hypothetical protein
VLAEEGSAPPDKYSPSSPFQRLDSSETTQFPLLKSSRSQKSLQEERPKTDRSSRQWYRHLLEDDEKVPAIEESIEEKCLEDGGGEGECVEKKDWYVRCYEDGRSQEECENLESDERFGETAFTRKRRNQPPEQGNNTNTGSSLSQEGENPNLGQEEVGKGRARPSSFRKEKR